jgi:MFS family permease
VHGVVIAIFRSEEGIAMSVSLVSQRDVAPGAAVHRLPLRALLGANTVSCIGNFMTLVALPWFVLETTGSAAKTGLAAMAVALPQVLAGFFAGSLIDRLGYKRTSVLADLAAGGTVALVPLLYHLHGLAFWQLLLLVFAGNLLNAPGNTARQSLLPDLIDRAGAPAGRANAWYQNTYNGGFLVGPLAAGLAIAAIGASNVLLLDAATFAFSAAAIALAIPAIAAVRAPTGRYADQLREGVRFIAADRLLLGLAATTAAVGFVGPAFQSVLLPVYARTLYGTPLSLGVLRAAFGGGMLLGTVLYGLWGARLPRRRLFAGLFVGCAPPLVLLLLRPSLALAAVALVALAAAFGPTVPIRATTYQERTPPALRSRVFGTVAALQFAAAPLGTLFDGLALQRLGIAGTLGMILAVWIAFTLAVCIAPALRMMDVPRDVATPGLVPVR